MLKLKIINIESYKYTLEDINNKLYNINIQFYGLKEDLKINDYIYICEKILNKSTLYSFGPLNSIYGKSTNLKEDELIKIISNSEEIYLKRYYG